MGNSHLLGNLVVANTPWKVKERGEKSKLCNGNLGYVVQEISKLLVIVY